MTIALVRNKQRLAKNAGIAIGPILFIIAVLGILASAIAAGSGSFTTSTTGESSRAKASAMIDIGQNLKIGFDRILGGGVDFSSINIDPTATSALTDLFSPIGGGISPPSVTMALDPSADVWHYPLIAVPNLGTTSGSRVAVLRVSAGVCDEINLKGNAVAAGTALTQSADIGDFGLGTLITGAAWPAAFDGHPVGCVHNTNATTITAGYYFYQVLSIQ